MTPLVDSYLASNRLRHIDELFELLSIPSISASTSSKSDIQRCADWIAEHMRGVGLENVELLDAGGNPVVYGDWLNAGPEKPTVLVYGHYDVQPPEPLGLWVSPAFEPTIRDGRIYARGASDNKGQFFVYLKAVECLLSEDGVLPVNVKLLIEGEEELRADNLERLLSEEVDFFRADVGVVSDSGFLDPGVPGIAVGLRGMAALNFTLRTAASDVHSGAFGGTIPNALQAMSTVLAGLRSPTDGRVLAEGFYDRVAPLPDEYRTAWAGLPFDEASYKDGLGVTQLFGEREYSPLERVWARPTLDVCGMWGGHIGEGVKTIIPCEAHAKVSCRLVPDQDPHEIIALLKRHLEGHLPPGADLKIDYELPGCYPMVSAADHPALASAMSALAEAYDTTPVLFRHGGSVPVAAMMQQILGLEPVLLGFSAPDENFHAPNEFFRLENLDRGVATAIRFLEILAEAALARADDGITSQRQ